VVVMGGGGAGDALGRVRCHKCWRAARTAAGQRRAVQNGRQWQGRGTRAAAQARAGRAAASGRGEAETRSEAPGGGGRGAGERLRWCKERLLEARGGGPKVWKRKGDSAGWPCGRGPLYPTGRPTVLACCVPKPKPFSPLSLPGRGGRPCKCAFSDTERTAFSTAVVSASAVGGHDAAHAHAHARRHAASSQQTASARSRPPTAMHLLAAHQRPSHHAAQHGAGTACGDTAALHAARPGSALSVQCACQRAQSPFQRSLRAGRGRADDLLAPSQAGVVDCMALQRAAGLIRHGRCRARACDLREPLIIHARRPRRPACSARSSLCCRLCHRAACARRLLAGGLWTLRSVACGRPALAAARSVVGPSSGS
jgi:hypothetical protein